MVREYSEAALGPELLASDDLMINDHIIPTFGEGGGASPDNCNTVVEICPCSFSP